MSILAQSRKNSHSFNQYLVFERNNKSEGFKTHCKKRRRELVTEKIVTEIPSTTTTTSPFYRARKQWGGNYFWLWLTFTKKSCLVTFLSFSQTNTYSKKHAYVMLLL